MLPSSRGVDPPAPPRHACAVDSRGRIALAVICVLAVAAVAVPALARKSSSVRTFTTGGFTVTCTSSGQLCSPPENLTINLPRHGTLIQATYTTAFSHCSAVQVRMLRGSKVVAKFHKVPVGDRVDVITPHIAMPKGKTTFGFQAQGFTGGCNAGHLGSWGGKVTVKVHLSSH
jgi:hypothetical protein